MKHLFIPYELALLAKQKRFNEPCIKGYNQDGKITLGYYIGDRNSDAMYAENKGHATAPLYQQIVDWFREKHKIYIHVKPEWYLNTFLGYESILECQDGFIDCAEEGATYYGALNKAITEAFKLI